MFDTFRMLYFFAIERFRITFKVNGKRQIKGENFSKKIAKNKIKNTKKKKLSKTILIDKICLRLVIFM